MMIVTKWLANDWYESH